jgi:hypothetical protein
MGDALKRLPGEKVHQPLTIRLEGTQRTVTIVVRKVYTHFGHLDLR